MLTQERGVFWLITGNIDVEHVFDFNTFEVILCTKGCVYTIEADSAARLTSFEATGNSYEDIYAR